MTQHFEFPSSSGVMIRARVVTPSDAHPPFRTIIMLTGDGPKGTKSLSWANLPPLFAKRGIATFLFDFEGLGYSEGSRRQLTVSRGLDNFRTAMAFLAQQSWVAPGRLGGMASSFGAAVLLLAPDLANMFSAIGLKSPAPFLPDSYLAEIGFDKFERWSSDGFIEENGYDFEVLLDSLKKNAFASAAEIRSPCLVTHGSRDEIVPIIQSRYLVKCLSGPARLEVFEGVGHGYSEEGAWDRMASLFVNWFDDSL